MPTLQLPIAQGHTPLLLKQVPRRTCDLALASGRRWGEREEEEEGRRKEEGGKEEEEEREGERD